MRINVTTQNFTQNSRTIIEFAACQIALERITLMTSLSPRHTIRIITSCILSVKIEMIVYQRLVTTPSLNLNLLSIITPYNTLIGENIYFTISNGYTVLHFVPCALCHVYRSQLRTVSINIYNYNKIIYWLYQLNLILNSNINLNVSLLPGVPWRPTFFK